MRNDPCFKNQKTTKKEVERERFDRGIRSKEQSLL